MEINSKTFSDVAFIFNTVIDGLEDKKGINGNIHICVNEYPFWDIYFNSEHWVGSADYSINTKRAIYKMLRICFMIEEDKLSQSDKKWYENFKKNIRDFKSHYM